MADFNQAQEFVKVVEGGYGNDSRDNGNWTGGKVNSGILIGTNHGISAPVLKEWLGRTPSIADMKNLPYSTALQIYKKNYWDALSLSIVENQSLALLIYDGAVNQGVYRLKGFLADSLSSVGIPASTSDSSSTLANKVNKAPQQQLYNTIKSKRQDSYNPDSPFYSGWMNRLSRLGFFLTEKTKELKKEVKKNPPMTLFVVLITATLLTAVILYKKQIISKFNK
jgi:lysozyme family protein